MPEPIARTYSLIVADVREPEVVHVWPLATGDGGSGVELQLGGPPYPVRVILHLAGPVVTHLANLLQSHGGAP